MIARVTAVAAATAGLLLLLLLLGAAPRAAPGQRPVVVGIVGDQTWSPDLAASYAILGRAVALLAARQPDVVLHVGDLVESSLTPDEMRTDFQQAAGLLDKLPVRWFLTAGDHDVSPPPPFQQGSADRSREALFQELYGARIPGFRQHPYYGFDVRGFHFVALYSQEALDADPRWGNIFLARIGDRQLAWLAGDLEAHRRARAVIVFVHQPLWYHWSGWRRVHALLRRYPVAAVVAGHLHYQQDEGELDGIRYLTVGATGASVKQGSRDAGNLQHVSILRVSGPRRVEIELLPVDGGGPVKLTPREDMDRVQALDAQLGNLFDFAAKNPVYLKAGRLVASCAGADPARLSITQIGDPIDLPLAVEIGLRSEPPGVALDAPAFQPGACATVISGTECILAPGARTEISDYGSVKIKGICPYPCSPPPPPPEPPLWQAALLPAGRTPLPGTVLSLRLRTRFQGASGEHFLERTVQTTVAACP